MQIGGEKIWGQLNYQKKDMREFVLTLVAGQLILAPVRIPVDNVAYLCEKQSEIQTAEDLAHHAIDKPNVNILYGKD